MLVLSGQQRINNFILQITAVKDSPDLRKLSTSETYRPKYQDLVTEGAAVQLLRVHAVDTLETWRTIYC